ncbi:hypothetical protein FRC03_000341 [Tulasnella sp. 419]|nr:hypothetical protein FRC03_000341 [Tulasnella sp. 419]
MNLISLRSRLLLGITASLLLLSPTIAQHPLQNLSLSDGCISAFLQLRISPVWECLNIDGFLGVITTSSNVSWIEPATTWATGVCSQNCTLEDRITSVGSVRSACSQDLESLGFTENTLNDIQGLLTTHYEIAKDGLCLRDHSNNDSLCLHDQLTLAEKSFQAPLNPRNVINGLDDLILRHQGYYPAEFVCSKCNQALYHLVTSQTPEESTGHQLLLHFGYFCSKEFKNVSNYIGGMTIN